MWLDLDGHVSCHSECIVVKLPITQKQFNKLKIRGLVTYLTLLLQCSLACFKSKILVDVLFSVSPDAAVVVLKARKAIGLTKNERFLSLCDRIRAID